MDIMHTEEDMEAYKDILAMIPGWVYSWMACLIKVWATGIARPVLRSHLATYCFLDIEATQITFAIKWQASLWNQTYIYICMHLDSISTKLQILKQYLYCDEYKMRDLTSNIYRFYKCVLDLVQSQENNVKVLHIISSVHSKTCQVYSTIIWNVSISMQLSVSYSLIKYTSINPCQLHNVHECL